MTNEEKAEEYVENKYHCNQSECIQGNSCDYCYREESKRDYLKGLEAGKPQWHEIESHVKPSREIEKQYMPKTGEKVLLKYHFYNDEEIHYSDGYYDNYDFEFHIPNNVTGRVICIIAWCELF